MQRLADPWAADELGLVIQPVLGQGAPRHLMMLTGDRADHRRRQCHPDRAAAAPVVQRDLLRGRLPAEGVDVDLEHRVLDGLLVRDVARLAAGLEDLADPGDLRLERRFAGAVEGAADRPGAGTVLPLELLAHGGRHGRRTAGALERVARLRRDRVEAVGDLERAWHDVLLLQRPDELDDLLKVLVVGNLKTPVRSCPPSCLPRPSPSAPQCPTTTVPEPRAPPCG